MKSLTKGESMDFAIRKIGGAIIALLIVAIVIVGAWGWGWNIVKAYDMLNSPITGMFIARVVGVFVAPLGAILGFL